MKTIVFPVLLVLMAGASGAAEEAASRWRLAGHAGIATRLYAYPDEPQRESNRVALRLEPEWSWTKERTRAVVTPRLFIEGRGSGRSRADFSELYLSTRLGEASLKGGISHVFWGVTESRHLVDVVNPPDTSLHYAGDERVPTAILQASQPVGSGQIELLLMPWERDPRFPGRLGRPRTALQVSSAVEHPDGRPPAFATRAAFGGSAFDAHVYFFRGLDRESVLTPRLQPFAPPSEFVASRKLVRQLGADFQMPLGNWLLKGELIRRSGYSRAFTAGVFGGEYTLNGFRGSDVDIGLMAEYQYDARPVDAPLSAMQHALFGGVRVALNDPASTEFKFGVLRDVSTPARIWRGDLSRRIGDSWTIEGSMNVFSEVGRQQALAGYTRDSYMELQLKYHFQ